jgi:hypothetical protein
MAKLASFFHSLMRDFASVLFGNQQMLMVEFRKGFIDVRKA